MDNPASTSSDRHTVFSQDTNRPAAFKGPFSEFFRWACKAFFFVNGWQCRGDWPAVDKCVVVAAPHTSNWDGIYMIAAMGSFRARGRWMGKKELTTGPFGWFVKWLGCVPVDRKAGKDMVQQMVDAFAAERDMVLLIPPEGTRARTTKWKTGYYQIAHAAGVPIVFSVLDWKTKCAYLSGSLIPSGDYEADLPLILSHYQDAEGKFPDQFNAAG